MTHQLSKLLALATPLFLTINTTFSQTNSDVYSPKFSHLSGRYATNIQVALTATTPNTTIRYTLDGTTPNNSSQLYTGTIPISGNGNQVTLKAIGFAGNLQSFVSSATYVIDYSYNPNANYLTNLSWTQYTNYLPGDWFGYTSTPWTCNYSVKVKILANGNYIDTTTSTSCLGPNDDTFLPVFYYGTTQASNLKTMSVYNILSSGYANGFITIDFGVGTNQYELRYIKFMDENNLFIEMWHNQNGPLKYYLTKNRQTLGLDDNTEAKTRIYPNPTSDFISIENLDSDVLLTNQLGQTLTLEKSDQISVSHLSKGIYFVQFNTTKGEQLREKLLIE
ncbi:chitobiase/beta-hexosaminidase C-terminal domain-containing protein [Fluviicola taffensis]|uniref:chitobiase/beta-hexosaminidase C-terminal domain-containing protein n=1 Tax=Fluviicola taffensis TaxID=191579 RepID=UPI00313821B6